MYTNQVDYFLMTHSKYLPASSLPYLRERLSALDEGRLIALHSIEFRDPTLTFILALFVCGVDRMLIGQVGLGVLKMLTAGGCGIWWLVDLFLIGGATREYNLRRLQEVLMII